MDRRVWLGTAALLIAAVGCNMATGADKIRLSDDDDGGATAGVTSGNGSADSGAGAGTTAAGPSGAGGATATAAGTGAGEPQPCTYPTGPYGVAQGQVVPPSLSWQGYAPGSSTPTTISIQDFHDCDGRFGINAIMVDTSQYG